MTIQQGYAKRLMRFVDRVAGEPCANSLSIELEDGTVATLHCPGRLSHRDDWCVACSATQILEEMPPPVERKVSARYKLPSECLNEGDKRNLLAAHPCTPEQLERELRLSDRLFRAKGRRASTRSTMLRWINAYLTNRRAELMRDLRGSDRLALPGE